MKVLTISQQRGHSKDFINYLEKQYSDIKITELTAPRFIKKRFFSKKSMVSQLFLNFFYFIFNLTVLNGRKFDFILLNSMVVAISYLAWAKLLPFIKPKNNIIVTEFFLHKLGTKHLIQLILKLLLNDRKIILTVYTKYDKQYFMETAGITKVKVIVFPYCQDDAVANDKCGEVKKYIFAGGYTKRDYRCLLDVAKNISYGFTIACSDLNKIPFKLENVQILRNLDIKAFNGYLKNSTIVIIPLEDDVGSAGHSVALSAMSLKKAIIYTNIDSLSDYFIQDVTGIPYKMRDTNDLTNKIKYLLANPSKRKELGNAAFKRYREHYNSTCYYEFLANLFLNPNKHL